jgi:hypothetical protein
LWKDQNLDVAQKNSIYEHTFIIKEVKQEQILTKIEGSKDQNFEESSSIKNDILEEFLEEAKEGNLKLIEENDENLEAKMIGILWKI